MNIAVLEGYVNNPGDLSWDALESYGTVTVYDRTPRDQLAQRVAEAGIVVSSKTVWDAEALGWAPRLKMIALTSTGYNVVDLDAARARGIVVSNVPAYSTPDVAQMTFALLLELCLHVGEHSQLVMDGGWTRAKDFSFWSTPLVELAGKTMGIVGMGSIGQAVGRIARAFGMPVVFENRSPKPQLEGDAVFADVVEPRGKFGLALRPEGGCEGTGQPGSAGEMVIDGLGAGAVLADVGKTCGALHQMTS